MDAAFSQLCVLGSSLVLIFGLILLWRRGVTAYISAFMWQSIVLAAVTVVVAHFGKVPELYWVAVCLLLLKGIVIPRLLRRMERRFSPERELEPTSTPQPRWWCPVFSCCSATRSPGRWWRSVGCRREWACRWRWAWSW